MNYPTLAAREIYKLILPHLKKIEEAAITGRQCNPSCPTCRYTILEQLELIHSLMEDLTNG